MRVDSLSLTLNLNLRQWRSACIYLLRRLPRWKRFGEFTR